MNSLEPKQESESVFSIDGAHQVANINVNMGTKEGSDGFVGDWVQDGWQSWVSRQDL